MSAEHPAAMTPQNGLTAAGCTCAGYWIDGVLYHDRTRCPIHSPLRDLSPMGGGPNPWQEKPK